MSHLSALIGVLFLAGCAYRPYTPSPEVLRQIPERMQQIRPDMDAEQLHQKLGLPQHFKPDWGGGDASRFWWAYDVAGRHSYRETWDETQTPHRLLMVQFDSYVWKQQAQTNP